MCQFLQPLTINDAVNYLNENTNVKVLAGGTDILIGIRNKVFPCDYVLDCKKIPETNVMEITDRGLEVGAAVSINALMESGLLTGAYDVLRQSGSVLANTLLRNRATIVGNVCNASPGGDMIGPCLVLNAIVVAASTSGTREIPLKDFFVGVKKTVLAPNEMVVKMIFPPISGRTTFRKKQRIKGHDLAQVSVSARYDENNNLSLAFGAVGPTPIFMGNVGTYTPSELAENKEKLMQLAQDSISPIGDIRSSKEYRIAMARYFVGQIVDEFSAKDEVLS